MDEAQFLNIAPDNAACGVSASFRGPCVLNSTECALYSSLSPRARPKPAFVPHLFYPTSAVSALISDPVDRESTSENGGRDEDQNSADYLGYGQAPEHSGIISAHDLDTKPES